MQVEVSEAKRAEEERVAHKSASTLCNTRHPDFPAVTCLINKGDHRDAMHSATTPIGVVRWPINSLQPLYL